MLDPRALATLGVGYGPAAAARLGLLDLGAGSSRIFLVGEFCLGHVDHGGLGYLLTWSDLAPRIDSDRALIRANIPASATLSASHDGLGALFAELLPDA